MKTLFVILTLLISTNLHAARRSSYGSTRVKGYYKKSGTYVAPSHKTKSNSTKQDNYSTNGNVNPYNGKAGTVTPER